VNRRAFLLSGAAAGLAGCTTAGGLTPANIQAWAAQVASYVQVLCGFIPDLTAVGNVITAVYPPGAVVTNVVTTIGNMICSSPVTHALTRRVPRMAMTLHGAMPVTVVHLVTTPAGIVAVPGHE
jgi:hypothetical protein